MKKTWVLYGVLLGVLVFILRVSEYWFWVRLNVFEIYAAIIAVLFLTLGLWWGKSFKKQNIPTYTGGAIPSSPKIIENLGISKREQEVLVLLCKGLSNQEIADTLFVSQNTIKTHTSRLFEKLDVKNRTHAIIKARDLGIISD